VAQPRLPSTLREVPAGVTAPRGFEAAGVRCGIKTRGLDLALIHTAAPAIGAGVFTTNRVQAAPVLVCRDRVRRGRLHSVVVNSGNANACTGARGRRDALRMAGLAARALGVPENSVLVCSTGIIGCPLPMDRVAVGITKAAAGLSRDGADAAAAAILTTDTRPKQVAVEFRLRGRPVRVGGMSKGAGMIAPDLATMLAFVTTDAEVPVGLLRSCLAGAVERSFNRITVDGDTSTNDTVLLLANGQTDAERIAPLHGLARFQAALDYVTARLAYDIVQDGEGASKVIEVRVRGARSETSALALARAIANSPLVKTALGGGDPNWGRILAAAGRAGVRFRPDLVDLHLGAVQVVRRGAARSYDEKSAAAAVAGSEIQVTLHLRLGDHEATVWTCDLTREYVRINSDYHT
jgi:glutamate N-acetyltransferase/amino-acid N-acetyltransferase